MCLDLDSKPVIVNVSDESDISFGSCNRVLYTAPAREVFLNSWKKMYKSNKNSKAGNKRRAFFFRRVNSILKNESSENSSSADFAISSEMRSIDDQNKSDLPERIKNWAIEHRIKKRALNSLLKILISAGFKDLSPDSRTLLRTPRSNFSNV